MNSKMKMLSLFIFILLLVLTFQVFQWTRPQEGADAASPQVDLAKAPSGEKFIGVRHVSAGRIRQLLPEAKGKPMLLEFKSRFCYDCKQVAPVLSRLLPKYKNVVLQVFDIQDDRAKAPALFQAFEPNTVPTLLFIAPSGEIDDVLYGLVTEKDLDTRLKKLNDTAKKA